MFLGVDSLKIVHPQKTNISILCPLKIDGWSRVDSFPKFEMLSAFLGGRIERSGPMVTWWPSTGAILLWHKITFDPVQVDVQRRGASALTLNHGLWPLDLCTEKKIWIFGDFWDLVFKYYIPFFKSSFLMDTKKTAEPLNYDLTSLAKQFSEVPIIPISCASLPQKSCQTQHQRRGHDTDGRPSMPSVFYLTFCQEANGKQNITMGWHPLWLTE